MTLIDFVLDFENAKLAYDLLWFLESDIVYTLEDEPTDDFPLDVRYSYITDTAYLLKYVEECLAYSCGSCLGKIRFDVIDSGQSIILQHALYALMDMSNDSDNKEESRVFTRLHNEISTLMDEQLVKD